MRRFPQFFLKLILFSTLLSLIPVSALGLYSFLKLSSSVQDKVRKANEQILLQTKMRIEQMLGTIEHSAVQLSSSQLINDALARTLTFNEFKMVFQIQSELKSVQTFDLPIQDVELANFEHGWKIDNDGLNRLTPRELAASKDAAPAPQTLWSLAVNNSGGCEVNYRKKVPHEFAKHYQLLIVKLPCANIKRFVADDNEIGHVAILDDGLRLVADSGKGVAGLDLELLAAKLEAYSDGSGKFALASYTSESSREMITFLKSDYNGWIYLSRTPLATVAKDSNSVGGITLLICIVIFIVNLALAYMISRRMYRPIVKLYQSAVDSAEHIKTGRGRDEFQIIAGRLYALMHTESELMLSNERQLPQLQDFFVLNLLEGKMKRDEIEHKLSLYKFPKLCGRMCVISLEIDDLKGTRYAEKDADLLLFAIHNMVVELVAADRRFHSLVIRKTVVVLVGGDLQEEPFKRDMYVLAEQVCEHVRQFLGLIVSAGISRTFQRLSDAAEAYDSSQEALKYKFRLGEGSIVFIDDVLSGSDSLCSFPEAAVRELLDAIKRSDKDKARQHLDECIQAAAEQQSGYNHFQIMLAQLLSELLKEIWKTGEPIPALQEGQQSVFNRLFELKALQDIEIWFWQVIVAPFIEMLAHRRRHRYRKISDIMLDIIHAEYDTDLTLEACALRMNYHPGYIKRAFREETGHSFSDYLAQYRLTKAKEWMLETDMTISAVAERLKYSNVQNFSRYFRKMEGVSPSQYKALHAAAKVPR